MNERLRRLFSLTGLGLWILFPFVYLTGTRARWERRCAGHSFSGTFDSCFNDSLPVFELLAFPLTLILAYPFMRFSFAAFAPMIDQRTFKWRFAGGGGGQEYFPAFQVISAAGICWAGLHIAAMLPALRYWHLIAYWLIWIGWFALCAVASFPQKNMRPSE